jgi:hypothetical protein
MTQLPKILYDSIDQRENQVLHETETKNPDRNKLINDLAKKIVEAVEAKEIYDGNKVIVRVRSNYYHPLMGGHSYENEQVIKNTLNQTLQPHGIQIDLDRSFAISYNVKIHSFSDTKTKWKIVAENLVSIACFPLIVCHGFFGNIIEYTVALQESIQ